MVSPEENKCTDRYNKFMGSCCRQYTGVERAAFVLSTGLGV
jgi:hypothetical protein